LISELKRHKEEWKSEIPVEILSGLSSNKNYRVRKNWWLLEVGAFENSLLELSPDTHFELIAEINDFISDFTSSEFRDRLTTKEDIDRADLLSDKIISALEDLHNSI